METKIFTPSLIAPTSIRSGSHRGAPGRKSNFLAIIRLPALLAALSLPAGLSGQTSPKVKTIGFRVIHEVVGEENSKLVPFNTFYSGTSLALLIESGGASIIKVDSDASKIDSFKDDGGNNLMVEVKGIDRNGIGAFPRISEDGKSAMVEINAGGVPDAKAGKLAVEGTLVLQLASKKKTIKSAPFELKKGVVVKVGDIEMKLKDFGKRSFGEEGVELDFRTSNKAITLVAGVKFYDESGAQLKSEVGNASQMGFGNKYTFGREYELMKVVKGKLVVEFEIWSDMVEKKVPFKIAVGMGG